MKTKIIGHGWDRGLWWNSYVPGERRGAHSLDGEVFRICVHRYTQGWHVDLLWPGTRRALVIGWFHFDWRERLAREERGQAA